MAATENPAPTAPDALSDLLEESWRQRGAALPRRELLFEGGLTAGLVALCLVLLAGSDLEFAPAWLVASVAVAYGFAAWVAYPLGAGNVVPTQPLLIVLFAVAPPAAVPLIVCLCFGVGTLVQAAAGALRVDRIAFSGGNAWHAVGPAVVLIAAGEQRVQEAPLEVLALAFAAQVAVDLTFSTAREWFAARVRPQMLAAVIAQVCALDLALAPLGLLAAGVIPSGGVGMLGLLPLAGIFAFASRDRHAALDRASGRLAELRRERARLRVAVERIGEAFASNLDLDAQLSIVTRATFEAVDATAALAATYDVDGTRTLRATIEEHADAAPALEEAERRARHARSASEATVDGWIALAAPMLDDDLVLGCVVVAREGTTFDAEDRDLLEFLSGRAGIAAANVLRHESLHRQALTDELTGLANHRHFQEVLAGAVVRYVEEGVPSTLMLLDLDDFKAVNDKHGHQTGDMVLRAVARTLTSHCRETDRPARYGGEELAIVVEGIGQAAAVELAERIRAAIAHLNLPAPDGTHIHPSISIGVATLDGDRASKEMLIAAADAALYTAKERGKNRVCAADDAEHGPSSARLRRVRHRAPSLSDDLPRAIDADELVLNYQPIVDLSGGRTVALEALVRWQHPDGLRPPAEFVAGAEREGLARLLGRWVLQRACTQAAQWTAAVPDLSISVNVSPLHLAHPDFVTDLAAVLAETGLTPASLVLELTEGAVLVDEQAAAERFAGVRALGARVAIDDFGTGHANLLRLLTFPVDIVKVPRPFVARIDTPIPRERFLCEHLIDLVQGLQLAIVAEGIERRSQADRLRSLGVELGQGFLYSRPLKAEGVSQWLQTPFELTLAASGDGATVTPLRAQISA